MRALLVIVVVTLLAAAPAPASARFDDVPEESTQDAVQDEPFDETVRTDRGIPDEQLRQDFDHRQFDGTMGMRQQPAPMPPYWGNMRPYWNSPEPPGVIHRGARTRGFSKTK
jgi:hypothetical protein